MSAYIPLLKQQHDSILYGLRTLKEVWKTGEIEYCEALSRVIQNQLNEHHECERKILFEKIKDFSELQQGGPFCTYYFDIFRGQRPFENAAKCISNLTQCSPNKISIPQHLEPFFKSNSLLTIPLEEHLSTANVLDTIVQIFEQGLLIDSKPLEEAFDYLHHTIQLNFEKEETCLWQVSQQVLDPQTLASLSKVAVATTSGRDT